METVTQLDGLPVGYLCGKLRNRIWNKFIIEQKQSTGIAKKVMCVCVCVCVCVCMCVECVCVSVHACLPWTPPLFQSTVLQQ